jgi:hypothetical protein
MGFGFDGSLVAAYVAAAVPPITAERPPNEPDVGRLFDGVEIGRGVDRNAGVDRELEPELERPPKLPDFASTIEVDIIISSITINAVMTDAVNFFILTSHYWIKINFSFLYY